MTNISKKRLEPKVLKTINYQFIRTISQLDQRSTEIFLEDFLTATERTMLAKRLAILLLLEEDFSPYRIAHLLQVSTSTVRRLHARISLKKMSPNKKTTSESNKFFKEFRDFLFEGLSMSPKRRMKWLDDFEKKYG